MSTSDNPAFQNQPAGKISVLVVVALLLVLIFGFRHFADLNSNAPRIEHHDAVRQIAVPSQFGWLGFIAKPLYLGLQLIHSHGIGNWGWAIVVLSLFFNLLTLWPRILSVRTSVKMARLKPKFDAVKARYAHLSLDDPKRSAMQAETMEIYKAEGASLYGGCMPMLLQMPLFIAYVRVLQGAHELHGAGWLWIADLAAPDPIHVLPLLIIATMVLTQYLTPVPNADPLQRRIFAVAVPLVMGVTLWHCASGLALYWLTGNLFGLVFQMWMNRSSLGRELRRVNDMRAA